MRPDSPKLSRTVLLMLCCLPLVVLPAWADNAASRLTGVDVDVDGDIVLTIAGDGIDPLMTLAPNGDGRYQVVIKADDLSIDPAVKQGVAQFTANLGKNVPAIDAVNFFQDNQSGHPGVRVVFESWQRLQPQVKSNTGGQVVIMLVGDHTLPPERAEALRKQKEAEQAEEARKVEVARQAEAAREAEMRRQESLREQAIEAARQAAIKKQQDEAAAQKAAELQRQQQAEADRQAKAAEAETRRKQKETQDAQAKAAKETDRQQAAQQRQAAAGEKAARKKQREAEKLAANQAHPARPGDAGNGANPVASHLTVSDTGLDAPPQKAQSLDGQSADQAVSGLASSANQRMLAQNASPDAALPSSVSAATQNVYSNGAAQPVNPDADSDAGVPTDPLKLKATPANFQPDPDEAAAPPPASLDQPPSLNTSSGLNTPPPSTRLDQPPSLGSVKAASHLDQPPTFKSIHAMPAESPAAAATPTIPANTSAVPLDTLINVGRQMADQNHPEKALAVYEAVERLAGDDIDTLYDLGMLYADIPQPDRARAVLTRFLNLDKNPQDPRRAKATERLRQWVH